jgi:hypothetical protein
MRVEFFWFLFRDNFASCNFRLRSKNKHSTRFYSQDERMSGCQRWDMLPWPAPAASEHTFVGQFRRPVHRPRHWTDFAGYSDLFWDLTRSAASNQRRWRVVHPERGVACVLGHQRIMALFLRPESPLHRSISMRGPEHSIQRARFRASILEWVRMVSI